MSGRTTYTWNGITFYRQVSDEFEPWFETTIETSKDTVLGAASAADSYIDTGGTASAAFTIRAVFTSAANRTSVINALGSTYTLSNTRSQSASAMLTKARRLDGGINVWVAELTFEAR